MNRTWRVMTPTASTGIIDVEAGEAKIEHGYLVLVNKDRVVLGLAPTEWKAVAPLTDGKFSFIEAVDMQ